MKTDLNKHALDSRAIGFQELAMHYFPDIAPASASIRLKAWIKEDGVLLDRLRRTNYRLTNRILKPCQTRLIIEAFGEPD